MIKYIFRLFIIFYFATTFKAINAENVFISYVVNGKIITNIDIEKEKRYLIALNTQLQNLNEQQLQTIATNSQIKEVLKEAELQKYYELDQKNPNLKIIIENFYKKLGLNSELEFKNYLKESSLTIDYVKKKVEIETTWNQLIYEKYKDQIYVDENKVIKRIKNNNMKKKKNQYLLSEILFELNVGEKLDIKFNQIINSINKIGFKNTANTFGISDSAKFGGNLGWIEEKNLNEKVINIIKKLEIGSYGTPIQIGNNFLILKVEDLKREEIFTDEKKQKEKIIQIEKNKQLESFSKIYYNKIKINSNISEK